MSYSITATGDQRQIQKTLRDAADNYKFNHAEKESKEHVNAAVSAALNLVKVVGKTDDYLMVSINGHANPDHGKVEGWSDEDLTVSISQVMRPVE